MLASETKKTGKGGRPSRLYRLSDDVIQLHFPFRDYMLLAKVAIETMVSLGEAGKKALYHTGKRFGAEIVEQEVAKKSLTSNDLEFDQKLTILKSAATLAGFYPEFEVNGDQSKIYFQIFNCPFKEVAQDHTETVCNMHQEFLKGMFEELFTTVELIEKENMITGCSHCSYNAVVTN
jgi:predicted ArsR family transcriptional regulator